MFWGVSFGQVLYCCFSESICNLGGCISGFVRPPGRLGNKARKRANPKGKTLSLGLILKSFSWLSRYLSVLIFVHSRDFVIYVSFRVSQAMAFLLHLFWYLFVEGGTFDFDRQYYVSAWFSRFGASWRGFKTRKTAIPANSRISIYWKPSPIRIPIFFKYVGLCT